MIHFVIAQDSRFYFFNKIIVIEEKKKLDFHLRLDFLFLAFKKRKLLNNFKFKQAEATWLRTTVVLVSTMVRSPFRVCV